MHCNKQSDQHHKQQNPNQKNNPIHLSLTLLPYHFLFLPVVRIFPHRLGNLLYSHIYIEIHSVPIAVVQIGITRTLIGSDRIRFYHLSSLQQSDTQLYSGSKSLFQYRKLPVTPKLFQIFQNLFVLFQISEQLRSCLLYTSPSPRD